MIKCSTEAYAKCQEHCHHCKTPDEAYFLEGSDCDKFNQQINHPPLTNAERIRAMSDEELAEWIARTQIGAIKDAMNLLRLPYDEPDGLVEIGKTEALEWLKQPAEVG